MSLYKLLIAILCLLLMNSAQARGAAAISERPFFVSAELPVAIGLGLPKTLSAHSVESGQWLIDLNSVIKSNANSANGSGESLRIDAESYNIELGLTYGLSDRWQLDVQAAYIRHTNGSLDGLIQQWHDFFGFSDGDRPLFEEDDFLIRYIGPEGQNNLITPSSGLSDIRLGLAYSIRQSWFDDLIVRTGVNLPTGDPAKLTGSDEVDFDIGIYTRGNQLGKWSRLAWHHNIGVVLIGDDSSFGIPTKDNAFFHSIGFNWRLGTKWKIKGQLDSHSPFFESNITELSKSASQLTLGLSYSTKKIGAIELYFSEDVTVNRAADFSIGLNARFAF